MTVLAQFVSLQVLDAMTTVAFLANGVEEANPLIRFLMQLGSDPWPGLAVAKIAAVVLACYCWSQGRLDLLKRANLFFLLLVAWNFCAVLVSS